MSVLAEIRARRNAELGDVLDPRDPMACARRLVADTLTGAGHRLLHHHRGSFWKYSQAGYYAELEAEDARTLVWTFLEKAKRSVEVKGKAKAVPFKPTAGKVSDVTDALTAVCHLESRLDAPAWLDSADEYPPAGEMYPVGNGLLHLPTGELWDPTPAFFALSASDVIYNEQAIEPAQWLTFLDQLWGADLEAIETLQDWMGYCLSPDTSQQKILLMVGPRRSGKGTIARVLTAIVGRDSVHNPTLAGLQTQFGLQPLIGKPLAIISDARLSGKSDQAIIAERLLSISGEDGIAIDRKYGTAWNGRLPTRFMILTNELPGIADSSGALVGRFIVLVLTQSFFDREDHDLANKLLAEKSAILNWALVGYRRLRARGHFIPPASAREAVADLHALGAPVQGFVNERCVIGSGCTVPVELLYLTYRTWCETNGRNPTSKQMFGKDLRAAVPGLGISQPRDDGDRARYYEGVRLK
jgi:putative DNA primase/helicase